MPMVRAAVPLLTSWKFSGVCLSFITYGTPSRFIISLTRAMLKPSGLPSSFTYENGGRSNRSSYTSGWSFVYFSPLLLSVAPAMTVISSANVMDISLLYILQALLPTKVRFLFDIAKYLTVFFHLASENSNFSPPFLAFSAFMVPPCSSTAFFTMASPSPVPPSLRLRPLSTL